MEQMPAPHAAYPIRAVDRVCDILDALAEAGRPVSLPEVAAAAELPKSSTFRYLAALEARRYVERSAGGGEYQLGPAFRSPDAQGLAQLQEAAEPVLAALRDRMGETTNLGLLEGSTVVHAVVCESPQMMRLAARVGERGLVHATALGKAMCAALPEAQVRAMLSQHGLPAFTDVWCTFINSKVFENAGVEIPSAEGWTWEKYIETAQKLTNLDEEIYGSLMLDYDCYNYMYALQNGAEHYKEDGTSNYDDPRFRDSVEFFYSLGNELQIQPDITTYKAGVYPWNAFPSTGVANADGSYDKAQFGMFVCGGWAASMLPDTEKYPRDWQCVILPMPYPEGQEPSTLTVPGCYAVPSTSQNKEAAFEAVRCIAENQYTLGYGRVPARVDLTDEETTDYIENGLVPTYAATDNIPAEQFKAAWFDPTRKVLSEKIVGTADTTISQIWTSEAPLYGMGQQDLDTTMQNILDRSNEAIKEAELY